MSSVILVDMDDVLAGFDEHVAAVWATRHPELPPIGGRRHHRIIDDLPPEHRA